MSHHYRCWFEDQTEAQRTNDRLIARLSKQSRTRRVTHIRLGNELYLNRTGARA